MKKTAAILVAATVAFLAGSIWLAMRRGPRRMGAVTTVHVAMSNNARPPVESADVSIEAMIDKITTLFERNVQGRQNPVSYGEAIAGRILSMTNNAERIALARRYTDVLTAMPLDVGTYADRVNKLDNIQRMVKNWDNDLHRIQFDPKTRIRFLLTMLGNFRNAVENGWKTDASMIEPLHVSTNAMQRPAITPLGKKFSTGSHRERIGDGIVRPGRPRTSRNTFVQTAGIELKNNVKVCRERRMPAIVSLMSPEEQEQTRKEVEETIKKMEIEKLLNSMNQKLKRDKQ